MYFLYLGNIYLENILIYFYSWFIYFLWYTAHIFVFVVLNIFQTTRYFLWAHIFVFVVLNIFQTTRYFLWAHIFVFVVWNILYFSFKILCIKKWCIGYCLDELFSLVFLSFSMCLVEEIFIYPNLALKDCSKTLAFDSWIITISTCLFPKLYLDF